MAKTIILEKVKSSEKVVRMLESDNVVAFIVDRAVTKQEVKNEVESLFNVKVDKIRGHTQKNKKIVYVQLNKEFPAIDVATKLGLM